MLAIITEAGVRTAPCRPVLSQVARGLYFAHQGKLSTGHWPLTGSEALSPRRDKSGVMLSCQSFQSLIICCGLGTSDNEWHSFAACPRVKCHLHLTRIHHQSPVCNVMLQWVYTIKKSNQSAFHQGATIITCPTNASSKTNAEFASLKA